jgi:hypothetical protein
MRGAALASATFMPWVDQMIACETMVMMRLPPGCLPGSIALALPPFRFRFRQLRIP